ncbi:MAG: hypothetical protein A3F16_03485 [Deltaproteobacteria bacterium RIFCSPHIGHO2_12_FULL_43_9]|nr:MAG: hypothetical protein A3F16_03485 [Deltaproteobacteria bacterium RIFCSPHIGHO2_12_FULL_43_9]
MERSRLLAIDIGNSRISIGVFDGNKKVERIDLPASVKTIDSLVGETKKADFSFVASVVPKLSECLLKVLKNPRSHFITYKDIPLQYKRVKNIERVGVDRLINGYCAYSSCQRESIVVGLGTATIVDGVTSKGEYLGGMILPGIGTMLKSLHENTAMLPHVSFSPTSCDIAVDTASAMMLGVQSATLGGIKEAIDKLKNVIPNARVVITGGWSEIFANLFEFDHEVNGNLTLQGIYRCGLKIFESRNL